MPTFDYIFQAFQWRYAVKRFDSGKKISAGDWEALASLLVLTPSAYGLQPWRFLLIQNQELRSKLRTASLDQTQIEDCSHLLVLTAKTAMDESYIDEFVAQTARTRAQAAADLEGFRRMLVDDLLEGAKSRFIPEWSARQAYLALGALLTASALLRIDACPIEGLIPERYDEILGLAESGYRTLAACALGYRSAADDYASRPKVRFAKERLLHER